MLRKKLLGDFRVIVKRVILRPSCVPVTERSFSDDTDPHEQTTTSEDIPGDDAAVTRQKILKASLQFVPDHGWSNSSLAYGAEAEGLPSIAHGMCPRGGVELVYYFYQDCNEILNNQMELEYQQVENGEKIKRKVNDFVRDIVKTRLKMIIPYKSTWPQALGLMALPQNLSDSLKYGSQLIDDIWYYAGDRSVDMNWYSKRLTLAGVYKSTELYMLQDKSENYENTWQFLDRRLSDLAFVGKNIKQVEKSCSGMDNLIWGAFTTARNMMGMNDRNR